MIILIMTKTLQQEIVYALMTYGVATKDDVKKLIDNALKPYATRKEVKEIVTETVMNLTNQATDDVLHGINELLKDIPKRSEVVLRKDLEKIYA